MSASVNIFLRILEKWACKHEWRETKQLTTRFAALDGGGIKCYIYLYVCKSCGKFKKVRME